MPARSGAKPRIAIGDACGPFAKLFCMALLVICTASCVQSFRLPPPEPEPVGPPCTATRAFGLNYSAYLDVGDARIVERNLAGLGKGVPSARLRVQTRQFNPPYPTVVATLTPRSGRIATVAASAQFRSPDGAYALLAEYQRLYASDPAWRIVQGRVGADGSTAIEVSNPLVVIRIALDARPQPVDPADPPLIPGAPRLRMVCTDRQMEAKAFGEALRALR